jgi:hypothetical protein
MIYLVIRGYVNHAISGAEVSPLDAANSLDSQRLDFLPCFEAMITDEQDELETAESREHAGVL